MPEPTPQNPQDWPEQAIEDLMEAVIDDRGQELGAVDREEAIRWLNALSKHLVPASRLSEVEGERDENALAHQRASVRADGERERAERATAKLEEVRAALMEAYKRLIQLRGSNHLGYLHDELNLAVEELCAILDSNPPRPQRRCESCGREDAVHKPGGDLEWLCPFATGCHPNATPQPQEEDCERCKGSGVELRQGCGEWIDDPCSDCNGTGKKQPECECPPGAPPEDWAGCPIHGHAGPQPEPQGPRCGEASREETISMLEVWAKWIGDDCAQGMEDNNRLFCAADLRRAAELLASDCQPEQVEQGTYEVWICESCGEQITDPPERDAKRGGYFRGHYHEPPEGHEGEDPWFDAIRIEVPARPSNPDQQGGQYEFEVFRDSQQQFRWRLLGRLGRVLATSDTSYRTEQIATRATEDLRSGLGQAAPHPSNPNQVTERLLRIAANFEGHLGADPDGHHGIDKDVAAIREIAEALGKSPPEVTEEEVEAAARAPFDKAGSEDFWDQMDEHAKGPAREDARLMLQAAHRVSQKGATQ